MTTREEDFFESAPSYEDNLPFDLRPIDPVLERKMTPDVRIRRVRLARVVAAVLGCGVLLLLAALAQRQMNHTSEPGTTHTARATAMPS